MMFTVSRTRVLATLIAAATVGLAMLGANGIPVDATALLRAVLPLPVGAALAQWLLFPLFARYDGGKGVALDILLWGGLIGLSGVFAGTLILPGAGTLLGALVTLSLPMQSPLAAAVYAFGATLGLWLMRRAKMSGPRQGA